MSRSAPSMPSISTTMTVPQINVRSLDGTKTYSVPIEPGDVMATLKQKVQKILASEEDIKIVFQGGPPELGDDDKILDRYPNGATVSIAAVGDAKVTSKDGQAEDQGTTDKTDDAKIRDNAAKGKANQTNGWFIVGDHKPQGVNVEITKNDADEEAIQVNAVINASNSDFLGNLFKTRQG